MKNVFTALLLVAISTLSLYAQSWQYANSFGGQYGNATSTPLGNNNQPDNLVVDNNGNAYLYGTYGNLMQLGDSTLPYFIDDTRGSFLTKINCNGEFEWVKSIAHSEQMDNQADYMILKDDYLYLTGTVRVDTYYKTWFLDTLVIGSILMEDYPDDCTYPWIPYRRYSYLIKMDLNGEIVDYHLFSFFNDNITKFNNVFELWYNGWNQRGFAIDSDGNYYLLAGLYSHQTSVLFCDNQPITDTITVEIDQAPYYMFKFDSEFNLIWYKSIISGINDVDNYSTAIDFFDMACDSQNNLYMVGYLKTNNTLGTAPNPVEVDLGNGQHLETYINEYPVGYLLKMNSEGEVQWTQQTKGYDYDGFGSGCTFESLLLDEETQNIYVTGYARQTCTSLPNSSTIFGDTDTLAGYFTPSNPLTGFIANYDMNGNYDWVQNIKSREGFVSSIGLYDNKLYGTVKWLVNLQHDQLYENSTSYGLALCVWDTAGNAIESIDIPTTCTNPGKLYPYDTRVNSWGEIFTTGTYDYGLTFGDHYIYGEGFKMFIAKYGNPCPIITDETETFCYGEEYNGTILTESGDYNFVLESSQPEVDSIVNLHATVYPQLTTGISDTTFCTNETYTLEANLGYNSYNWSTGSTNSQQELTYTTIGTENVYVTLTDDNCTGVDTIVITIEVCNFTGDQQMPQISIYPVPANTHITVQLSDSQKIEAYSVFNLQGKLIKSKNVSFESSFTITTNELPAGQYLIYVKTVEGVYTGGFVKE